MTFGEIKKIMNTMPIEYDDYDVEMFDGDNEWLQDVHEVGINTERKSIVVR